MADVASLHIIGTNEAWLLQRRLWVLPSGILAESRSTRSLAGRRGVVVDGYILGGCGLSCVRLVAQTEANAGDLATGHLRVNRKLAAGYEPAASNSASGA
jgi:hypothetical protein